ncbi:MAG: hypothetical protein OXG35_16915 [Acidobacteria bacterium]|nr:hypothetical protein [Acidobacteriota bacterium]
MRLEAAGILVVLVLSSVVATADAEKKEEDASQDSGGRLARFLSEIDLQGRFSFSSSAGREPTFALTARFRRPYLFSALGDRNQISFGPLVALRANSSDQDDENSVIVSAPVVITRSRGPLRVPLVGPEESPKEPLVSAFVLNAGPRLEVDKSFGRGNLIADGELGFGLVVFGGKNQDLNAWPYVGLETGARLAGRDDTSGAEHVRSDPAESIAVPTLEDTIARLKAGVDARYRLSFEGDRLHEIVFDLEFVYRQLYAMEPRGRWVTSREEGRRLYVNAAIRFAFTENWEFVVSYARGELPPLFVEVSKVEAGFGIRLGDRF